jgi:hypothetical protein
MVNTVNRWIGVAHAKHLTLPIKWHKNVSKLGLATKCKKFVKKFNP